MTTRRTYCFKLYRNKRNKRLHRQIALAAEIYNHCIALHKRYYRLYKKHLNVNRLQKHLTKLKKQERYKHWNSLGSQAIQDIAQRIEKAYQLFFAHPKRFKPPGFKSRRKYKSFTLKQAGYKLLDDNKIKVGNTIFKFSKSREIEGEVKTLSIKRDALGDLYLCFSCVLETQAVTYATTGNSAGFDFGLKTFLVASDGSSVVSPLFFRQNAAKIKAANKRLSSKKAGSNNRRRTRRALALLYSRVTNARKDFHWKLALDLARRYDNLYFEDLNLKAMQRLYGKKIGDLGFANFLSILETVCAKRGKTVSYIGRFEPSSKTCSCCGHVIKELPLSVRAWDCPSCGANHDRDLNAAKNIYRVGASTHGLGDVNPALPQVVAV